MTREDHAPFTHIVETWLDSPDGFLDPDTVLDRVMAQVDTRPQRRAGWPERRIPHMNKFLTIGLGAAAVVVLLVGPNLLGSSSSPPGGAPSDSAAPSSSGDGSLPVGPHVMDPVPPANRLNDDWVTVTIPAPGWFAEPDEGSVTKDLGGGDRVRVEVVFQDYYRVPSDMCGWQSASDIPLTDTVDRLVAALAAQTYNRREGSLTRVLSTPADITIDGYPGPSITYPGQSITGVVPDDPGDCDQQRFCSLTDRDGAECLLSHREPGALVTFWIVDPSLDPAFDAQAGASPRVVAASYWPTTSTELLDEMNAIVESMTSFAHE